MFVFFRPWDTKREMGQSDSRPTRELLASARPNPDLADYATGEWKRTRWTDEDKDTPRYVWVSQQDEWLLADKDNWREGDTSRHWRRKVTRDQYERLLKNDLCAYVVGPGAGTPVCMLGSWGVTEGMMNALSESPTGLSFLAIAGIIYGKVTGMQPDSELAGQFEAARKAMQNYSELTPHAVNVLQLARNAKEVVTILKPVMISKRAHQTAKAAQFITWLSTQNLWDKKTHSLNARGIVVGLTPFAALTVPKGMQRMPQLALSSTKTDVTTQRKIDTFVREHKDDAKDWLDRNHGVVSNVGVSLCFLFLVGVMLMQKKPLLMLTKSAASSSSTPSSSTTLARHPSHTPPSNTPAPPKELVALLDTTNEARTLTDVRNSSVRDATGHALGIYEGLKSMHDNDGYALDIYDDFDDNDEARHWYEPFQPNERMLAEAPVEQVALLVTRQMAATTGEMRAAILKRLAQLLEGEKELCRHWMRQHGCVPAACNDVMKGPTIMHKLFASVCDDNASKTLTQPPDMPKAVAEQAFKLLFQHSTTLHTIEKLRGRTRHVPIEVLRKRVPLPPETSRRLLTTTLVQAAPIATVPTERDAIVSIAVWYTTLLTLALVLKVTTKKVSTPRIAAIASKAAEHLLLKDTPPSRGKHAEKVAVLPRPPSDGVIQGRTASINATQLKRAFEGAASEQMDDDGDRAHEFIRLEDGAQQAQAAAKEAAAKEAAAKQAAAREAAAREQAAKAKEEQKNATRASKAAREQAAKAEQERNERRAERKKAREEDAKKAYRRSMWQAEKARRAAVKMEAHEQKNISPSEKNKDMPPQPNNASSQLQSLSRAFQSLSITGYDKKSLVSLLRQLKAMKTNNSGDQKLRRELYKLVIVQLKSLKSLAPEGPASAPAAARPPPPPTAPARPPPPVAAPVATRPPPPPSRPPSNWLLSGLSNMFGRSADTTTSFARRRAEAARSTLRQANLKRQWWQTNELSRTDDVQQRYEDLKLGDKAQRSQRLKDISIREKSTKVKRDLSDLNQHLARVLARVKGTFNESTSGTYTKQDICRAIDDPGTQQLCNGMIDATRLYAVAR